MQYNGKYLSKYSSGIRNQMQFKNKIYCCRKNGVDIHIFVLQLLGRITSDSIFYFHNYICVSDYLHLTVFFFCLSYKLIKLSTQLLSSSEYSIYILMGYQKLIYKNNN